METLKLTLLKKNVYGNTLYYPKCDISNLICKLMGKKTLTERDLDRMWISQTDNLKIEVEMIYE